MRADRADDEVVTVRLPADPPVLTSHSARTLLGILVELTTVPVMDRPSEGGSDER